MFCVQYTTSESLKKKFYILSKSHQAYQNFCTVCTFTNFACEAIRFTVSELKIWVTFALCEMAV